MVLRPVLSAAALVGSASAGPASFAPGMSSFDLIPKALFTHKDSELHCPDRELIHPCTTELRGYLKGADVRDVSFRKPAYECAQKVYESNDDFWVIKNMTHLFLDLDTSKHFFDKQLDTDDQFFQLGLKFGRKLLTHKECLVEFDQKDELECRCPHLYAKIIMLKLKNLNKEKYTKEAEKLFKELTEEFEWNGELKSYGKGDAFKWKSMHQTPQIWFDNLESIPVWPQSKRPELPIWDKLEENYPSILDETMAAYKKADAYRAATNGTGKLEDIKDEKLKKELEGAEGLVEDAYRFLFQGGNWDQILLYHGRNYTPACEKSFPKTCAMLKEELPKRPQHSYPWVSNQNEQVLALRLKVGTDVETHCGPGNNILNIHLGLTGTEGAVLIVNNETHGWEDGKVIAWDGSYDHKVHCLNCKKDRYILMVRYMHPGITPDHYRGNDRTHFEEIPMEWREKWAKENLRDDL